MLRQITSKMNMVNTVVAFGTAAMPNFDVDFATKNGFDGKKTNNGFYLTALLTEKCYP